MSGLNAKKNVCIRRQGVMHTKSGDMAPKVAPQAHAVVVVSLPVSVRVVFCRTTGPRVLLPRCTIVMTIVCAAAKACAAQPREQAAAIVEVSASVCVRNAWIWTGRPGRRQIPDRFRQIWAGFRANLSNFARILILPEFAQF